MALIPVSLAFIEGLGGPEMMLVFVIILVMFGGQKLPEFARGLGKTMREFKKAASGVEEEFKRALEEDERKKTASAYLPPPETPSLLPAGSSDPTTAALATTVDPVPQAQAEAGSTESIPTPPLIPGPFASANADEYGELASQAPTPTPAASAPPVESPSAAPVTPPIAATETKRPDPPS